MEYGLAAIAVILIYAFLVSGGPATVGALFGGKSGLPPFALGSADRSRTIASPAATIGPRHLSGTDLRQIA